MQKQEDAAAGSLDFRPVEVRKPDAEATAVALRAQLMQTQKDTAPNTTLAHTTARAFPKVFRVFFRVRRVRINVATITTVI